MLRLHKWPPIKIKPSKIVVFLDLSAKKNRSIMCIKYAKGVNSEQVELSQITRKKTVAYY